MKDLVTEIDTYILRNANNTTLPILNQAIKVKDESEGTKFIKNIDSASAVSQVLNDIMSPLNLHSRSPSLDVMVDVTLNITLIINSNFMNNVKNMTWQ